MQFVMLVVKDGLRSTETSTNPGLSLKYKSTVGGFIWFVTELNGKSSLDVEVVNDQCRTAIMAELIFISSFYLKPFHIDPSAELQVLTVQTL